jgi:hypothetical protein
MKTRSRVIAYGLAVGVLGMAGSAMAFECPAPQASSPFVLKETQQQQNQLSQLLASGDVENRLGEIVTDLRQRHPEASRVEIVNYLVAAYCPAVAAMPGVSDDTKTQKVRRFAEGAFDVLATGQL